MLRTYILLSALLLSLSARAADSGLLEQLDAAIEQRAQLRAEKDHRIESLKKDIRQEADPVAKLHGIEKLYREYHVFQFDSAMTCAEKGFELATQCGNEHYRDLFSIHRAEILAIGGLYVEATQWLDGLQPELMERQTQLRYYMAAYNVYSYWASYSQNTPYSAVYWQKALDNLRQGIACMDSTDRLYNYFQGEYFSYIEPDAEKARLNYQKAIARGDSTTRVYAMASYALANNYLNTDQDEDRYEEYLIRAAMADLRSCTMETVAMQVLATRLFGKGEDYLERAERYINVSMEDAKFYNNRLRILEISRILPQIMESYQNTVEQQNRHLRYYILFISLLVLALLITAYFIYRQNKKLNQRRLQLAEGHDRQKQMNAQLQQLNQQLADTNRRRERLASIYIDLCAKYIDKLGKYQTLVKRKIKAHQEQELLQTISSTRISEEDATTFLTRFDKAFLELYPTFVDELNALLQPDGRIQQKSPHTLTTELRTFALIRLGVKNTTDIAGLLFLSNQTIYNCRSITKNKAINKETFDEDIMQLCTVIR